MQSGTNSAAPLLSGLVDKVGNVFLGKRRASTAWAAEAERLTAKRDREDAELAEAEKALSDAALKAEIEPDAVAEREERRQEVDALRRKLDGTTRALGRALQEKIAEAAREAADLHERELAEHLLTASELKAALAPVAEAGRYIVMNYSRIMTLADRFSEQQRALIHKTKVIIKPLPERVGADTINSIWAMFLRDAGVRYRLFGATEHERGTRPMVTDFAAELAREIDRRTIRE